jgi:glycosyltransferase involved in cell wall biosynthesis
MDWEKEESFMRIAQVAPLWESVPPRTYGGSELVVYLLTEELVRRGHEVTLFAAGGTQTSANLVTCCPSPLREMEERIAKDKTHCTVMSYELQMLQTVFNRASDFDIIHNHVGFQPLPFAEFVSTPMVTTLHNALEPLPVRELFFRNAHLPYISISDYQQQLWPELNYAATIYHGIDLSTFNPSFDHEGKDYLVFLGRLSPEKGPHHAIQAALALDMPLIMAGKIDRVDRAYYDREIAPLVDGEKIKYIGEVNHAQKVELLRHAAATLCPIEWPEPFGLVMIESMACGTPVFALRDGSVPEVINHGVTGYVANSVQELIDALRQYKRYDRRKVRQMAEQRFSVQRMVDDHLKLYTALAENSQHHPTGKVASLTGDARPGLFDHLLTPSQVAAMKYPSSPKRGVTTAHKSRFNPNREVAVPTLEHNLAASQENDDVSEYYPDAFTGP